MAFIPETLRPEPDPDFVRQLKKIDPDLRVVFAYDTYLKRCWAIERRMAPERYFLAHASLFEKNEPRFVEQPILDGDQPIYNDDGEQIGFREVGRRRYDLAPEYEHIAFAETLDDRVLVELRRYYAEARNPRTAIDIKNEQLARREKERRKSKEVFKEARKELWREYGITIQGQQPSKVMEGTEI